MTAPTITPAIDRAREGAALLDDQRPDWVELVDPDILEIRSLWRCILGQVFGSFDEGLNQIALERPGVWSGSYGFSGYDTGDYDALNEAWRTILVERAS